MFKLGMALVFSVIAALIVFITGLVSDARIMTAFGRGFIAFVSAGIFTYLAAFILEAKGWAAFDKDPTERMKDMQATLYDAEDIDFEAVEKGSGATEEFAASSSFRPLSEDAFTHMRSPAADEPEDRDGAAAPA